MDERYPRLYTDLMVDAVEMFLGCELYRKKDWFMKHAVFSRIFGLGIFVIAMIYRFCMETIVLQIDEGDRTFLFATQSVSIFVIVGVFMFFLSFNAVDVPGGDWILKFSSLTFFIYLVHMPIKMKLDNLGIYWNIHDKIMGLNIVHGKYLLFSIIMMLLVLLASIPFAIIIKYISKGLQWIWDQGTLYVTKAITRQINKISESV